MKRGPTLVVLFAVAMAMLVSTSAFTTVAADRSADISVVGDAHAVVQLVPYTDGNGQQSQLASVVDGQLQIKINVQSEVDARNVFNITNQGTQPVAVWITDIDTPSDVAGGVDENNTAFITFYNPVYGGAGSFENGVASVEGRENAVELGVGETLTVSLFIETTTLNPAEVDLLDEMIVHADANVDGTSEPTNADGGGDAGSGAGGSGSANVHPLPNQQLTIPSASSPKTLQIGNTGTGTLQVSDLQIVGADAPAFAIVSGDTPFTLEPGSGVPPTHTVTIEYTGTGHATAQLEIVSNDPDEPTRVVELTGTPGGGSGNGNGGGNGDDGDHGEED